MFHLPLAQYHSIVSSMLFWRQNVLVPILTVPFKYTGGSNLASLHNLANICVGFIESLHRLYPDLNV